MTFKPIIIQEPASYYNSVLVFRGQNSLKLTKLYNKLDMLHNMSFIFLFNKTKEAQIHWNRKFIEWQGLDYNKNNDPPVELNN